MGQGGTGEASLLTRLIWQTPFFKKKPGLQALHCLGLSGLQLVHDTPLHLMQLPLVLRAQPDLQVLHFLPAHLEQPFLPLLQAASTPAKRCRRFYHSFEMMAGETAAPRRFTVPQGGSQGGPCGSGRRSWVAAFCMWRTMRERQQSYQRSER